MKQRITKKERFLAMGEIMLRLTPPDCEKIRNATSFEAIYGGSEANIAVSLANLGMLANFVGMLTDSRSFLSYPRHEYFRRILCNLLGTWVENGEYPDDMKRLGKIVKDISYNNAVRYFGFDLQIQE